MFVLILAKSGSCYDDRKLLCPIVSFARRAAMEGTTDELQMNTCEQNID